VLALAHHRRLLEDHPSVCCAVILCLLVFKPLLCTTSMETHLLVTLYSEPARRSSMSAVYLQSGCQDASVTGQATFRWLLSRFLDLELREVWALFLFLFCETIMHCCNTDCLHCDHSDHTVDLSAVSGYKYCRSLLSSELT